MTNLPRKLAPALVLAAVFAGACGEQSPSAPCSAAVDGATAQLAYRIDDAERDTTARSAAERLCARLRSLGHERLQVTAAGGDRVRVIGASVEEALAAVRSATARPSLRFYDWEPSVLGPRGPDAPFAGGAALFDAVGVAATSGPRGQGPGRVYLFGPDRRPLRGPADSCAELLAGYARYSDSKVAPASGPCAEQLEVLGSVGPPEGSRVLRVPAGVAVLEDRPLPGQPTQLHRYFVIEDDPELSTADITRPRAQADEITGEPVVSFRFTSAGRRAFKRLTAEVARRGARLARRGGSPEQTNQRFAIVVDDEVISLATIGSRATPDGIDAPGAQVGPLDSPEGARRLARRLSADPLGFDLALVSVRLS